MKVVEIFRSIEGEGALIGQATTFIRLFGCNMRCFWCDSAYSYEGEYKEIAIEAIAAKAALLGGAVFSVTGGEPFIHSELGALCDALLKLNKKVKIETNGTLWQEIDKRVYIVVSPKPPKYEICEPIAQRLNELKFVADDDLKIETLMREPFLSAYKRGAIATLQLESNKSQSLKRALALQNEALSSGGIFRVLPQLHKLLDLP
ncbi:MAG: 7-carboxy-7-deazaguanine synthase QueE [Helicobacteraceae bacterium]|jgi:organic radical activating enzyme|nr:7-carboxy-7-deazaguanine synthase QueE [Helicobacteraceae bacterium]